MLGKIDKAILHQTIIDISSEIAANFQKPVLTIDKWLTACCEKLHSIYLEYGQIVFAFIVQMEAPDMLDLNVKTIQELVNSGQEVCIINQNLSLSLTQELKVADQIEIGNYGEDHNSIVFRLNGELLEIYIRGRYKHRINIMHPESKNEIRVGLNARRCRDYILAIEDHSKKELIFMMDKYWANKQKRILKPGKTERIFQMELFDWLLRHIYDGRPYIEMKTNVGDRTDIDIQGYQCGQHYIIEVKWLGENESGTIYGKERIIQGIGQINTYLQRDVTLNEACLVCYDARSEEKHKTESDVDQSIVPVKGKYRIIFLESESASKKGEAYVNRSQLGS